MKSSSRRSFFSLIALLGTFSTGAFLVKKNELFKSSENIESELSDAHRFSSDDIADGYIVSLGPENAISPGYSVYAGQRLGFCLSGDSDQDFGRLDITDVLGATVATTSVFKLERQKTDSANPWKSGLGFSVSVQFEIPKHLKSGIYFLANKPSMFFIVKRSLKVTFDSRTSNDPRKKLTILISTNTFNAYSVTSEASLYTHPTKVPKVSFFRTQNFVKAGEWLPCLKWIAVEEYLSKKFDIGFIADIDMETSASLADTDILLVLGHSEYWTRSGRVTFDEFVSNGGDAIVASGNTMWWQVRYEDERSTLVSYKNKSRQNDPEKNTPTETSNWYVARLKYPIVQSIGGDFRYGGYGKFRRKQALGWKGYRVVCEESPLISNIGLKNNDVFNFFKLKEYDGPPILGFDENGFPVPNLEEIAAYKYEMLGFDLGFRAGHTVGAMHVMQKAPDSGVVFLLGAKDFSVTFTRKEKKYQDSTTYIKKIFINFLEISRTEGNFFSVNHAKQRDVVLPMVTPFKGELDKKFFWTS